MGIDRLVETASAEETEALGREFAATLRPGDTVLLIGDLGAGKTTLAKGLVEGLTGTSASEVTSPTYTLVHEYGAPVMGRRHVLHVDLYRLEEEAQVVGLGLDDYAGTETILVIEWGERFPQLWAERRWELTLAAKEDSRTISITRR